MNKALAKGTLQTCFSDAWGGLEMVAYETAVKLKAGGIFNTTVCAPDSPLQKKLTESGLDTISLRRGNKYFSPHSIRTIRRALKSGKYSSVLVEQMNELWQVVPAMWGMRSLRLVGISHTFVGISKKDFLHTKLYGRMNHLIALTEIHKNNLLSHLPVKEAQIAIIPNAVDLQKFNPTRKNSELRQKYLRSADELLLGVVSRIDKGKGLAEVIEAAGLLKQWNIPFRMIIVGKETVGEGGMLALFEDQIRKRNLNEQVLFVGHRADVETVMASLDILLMPSPNETFGRILIEAMASGVPVVASSGGGVANIVHDDVDGMLVKPLAVGEMAEAVRTIYNDPAKRQRLASAGLKSAAERYDSHMLDRKLFAMLGLI